MANRKEDEKNEKIIRGLLKLPENRRCINCNSLGPQYVCTNFWTFVCTNCSGIHREFTHRVKSISMAKFTSQEVMSLKQGGNQRAKEIFLKNWDSQRQSFPDNSNVDRLRTFIKHVYVDRRYSGERNYDKPPRGEKEEGYDNRRTDQGGSRSPPYEEVFERRFSGRSSPGGRSDDRSSRYSYDERRSPGYDQDRKSPARPEVVNDWRREDRFGNARRTEDRRISDADVRSPERQKSLDVSSPPEVRPVRDILGENVVPLRVNEPPKPSGGRIGDGPAPTQRTASSSSLGSTSSNPVEVKLESSKSLIDFDAEPEPPASVAPQAPQTTTDQSVAQPPASSSDNNWASFDFAPQVNTSQPPTGVNPLDSVLSELCVPASVPGGAGSPTVNSMGNFGMLTNSGGSSVGHLGNTTTLPPSAGATAASPRGNSPTFFPAGAPVAAHGQTPVHPHVGGGAPTSVSTRGQRPILQHQPPSPHAVFGSQPNQTAPMGSIAANNQTLNMSVSQNAQGPLGSAALQTSQAVSRPGQDVSVSSGVGSQPPLEVTPTGRRALPEDLFTVPPYPAPFPAWQTGPPRAMGFTMQYNPVMQMPTFQPTSRSINPFDVNNEPAPTQAPVFPSMTSLQNALPNVPPQSGLLQTSGFGTPSPALGTPQAPPYIPGMPPQVQSFPSAMPPRPYMGQQPTSNMPFSSQQQQGGMGSEGDAFGSFNMDQQFGGGFLRPPNSNPSSSAGGNPFG